KAGLQSQVSAPSNLLIFLVCSVRAAASAEPSKSPIYGLRLAGVHHCETAQRLEIILDTRLRELPGNQLLVGDVCAKTAEEVETCAKPVVRHRPANIRPHHRFIGG